MYQHYIETYANGNIYQNLFQTFKVKNSQEGVGSITWSVINNLHSIALGSQIPTNVFVPELSQQNGWRKFGHDFLTSNDILKQG